jgi:hypothetical protein
VVVEMRNVTNLDACALLRIVAELDRLRRVPGVILRGTYPSAPDALRAMHDADFEKFFRIPPRIGGETQQSLEITYGDTTRPLDPKAWLPLYTFLEKHGGLGEEATEDLYAAFGECVENVRQHAYGAGQGRWYALAIRPSAGKPARAVILDRGVGIAGSITKTIGDRAKFFFGRVMDAFMRAADRADSKPLPDEAELLERNAFREVVQRLRNEDWASIYLATQGMRTETDQSGRGTGLSGLRHAVLEKKHGALHVLSGAAAITWEHDLTPKANTLPRIRGTIVCLEFRESVPGTPEEPTHG